MTGHSERKDFRSYPSHIAGLQHRSTGILRGRYIYLNLQEGQRLELRPEPGNVFDPQAVAYFHGVQHLGYVPREHHWVGRLFDEHLNPWSLIERINIRGFFRHQASYVKTRIFFDL